jgi:3-hydroxymyristoyl/3-hydroxydecanoyl-(acyl carrier protein) dehydratase
MSQEEAIQYIPQRPPFVMIDKVTKADETISQTNFTIREGHMFVDNGYFTEPGLVENMAQTAGGGIGYRAQMEGKPVTIGYIGALKNLNVKELPAIGDTIVTEINYLQRVMNVHLVTGTILLDGREIANCEFRIFEKKD